MLQALATLLVFQCLGEGISYLLRLPVPGPVVGMLLLLLYLVARPQAVASLEGTAFDILRHLSLLFVPAGVGIMVSAQSLDGDLFAVVLSVAVSTALAIVVTALVMRAMLRRQRRSLPEPGDRA
jgi:holin-like protein